MKRKFTLLAAALMLLSCLAVPLGMRGQQTYTQITELDMTTKAVGCSAYNTSTTYTNWTIVNGANNNKGWAFFKMGGKSTTISSYNPCYIYSPAITEQVDKVTVHLPAGSLSQTGMSVNSWGLYVYSNSAMTTEVDYVAGGTITNTEGSFDFTPSTGITWAANYYYKVSWNLANTTGTNGIVCVDKITLYKESGAANTYGYTMSITGETSHATAALYVGGVELQANDEIAYGAEVTVSVVTDTGYDYSVSVVDADDNTVTYNEEMDSFIMPASTVTITVNITEVPTYTVTFHAGSGTFVDNTDFPNTSNTIAAGTYTLPTATPSAACITNGWTFAGWSTTNVTTTTTTAPTLEPTSYTVNGNVDLYAVYKKEEAGGSAPSAFSVGNTGSYAVVAGPIGNKYYALPTDPTVNSGKIDGLEITVSEESGVKYIKTADAEDFTWTIAAATNGYTLYDGSKYIYHSNGGDSGTNLAYGTSTNYTWSFTEDGDDVKMYGMYGSTIGSRGMLYNGTAFGGYSMGNWDASGYYHTMILPVGDATIAYYATSPSCNPVYAVEIDNLQHGTIVATPSQAEAGEEVTLTITPDNCYQLKPNTLVVLDGNADPVSVTNNAFIMPASDVTVSAEFEIIKYTVQYSVNGTIETALNENVNCGSNATLPTTGITVPEGCTFAGWSNSSSSTTILDSYEPTNDAVLYAVFGKTSEGVVTSKTVILDGSGLTSTATSADYTYTNNGFTYILSAGAKQISSSGTNRFADKAILIGKEGKYIYNTQAFGQGITSFEVYANAGASAKVSVGINFSTAAIESYNASATNTWAATLSTLNHVYDASSALPEGAKYFWYQITNDNNSQVQFRITYNDIVSTTLYYTLIKDVTGTETMASIEACHLITVKNGGALTLTGANNGTAANLIIEDGGQLIPSNAVSATMQKDVEAYSDATGEGNTDGWYFIALPLNSNEVTPSMLTTGDYDLYHLNPSTTKWENYKTHSGNANPGFTLANGEAYLYANSAGFTINFAGTVKASAESQNVSVSTGWNLVGNPFTYNTYLNRAYYKMNGDRKGIEIVNDNAAIAPCTGVIVKATTEDHVTFTQTDQSVGANHGNVQMVLAQTVTTRGESSSQTLDNAIVSFNEGSKLAKFYFGRQDANLYIPQGTEEYAIVSANGQGTMPVSFRANENGEYTLTVNAERVEMNYLHLIDNMTGADIDLLQTPSYTFNAKTTDYESRFRLVFAANNEDGSSTGSETFSFFSNGNWVISNEGEATLQVIDALGRILSSEGISGTVSKSIDAPAGVYVLRLINGDSVRTQKIVVR